jgi:hypothetical protein
LWNVTYEDSLTEKRKRIDMFALYALLSHGAGWSIAAYQIGLAYCGLVWRVAG